MLLVASVLVVVASAPVIGFDNAGGLVSSSVWRNGSGAVLSVAISDSFFARERRLRLAVREQWRQRRETLASVLCCSLNGASRGSGVG